MSIKRASGRDRLRAYHRADVPQAMRWLTPNQLNASRRLILQKCCPQCAQPVVGSEVVCEPCLQEKAREFAQRSEYMDALSPGDKLAGRQFVAGAQAALDDRNAERPAELPVPHYVAVVRHDCPATSGRTTPIETKEIYAFSPAYCICDGIAREYRRGNRCRGDVVPAGRFGFIYREGQCRHCQLIARSLTGRLVDGWTRPPIHGRRGR